MVKSKMVFEILNTLILL